MKTNLKSLGLAAFITLSATVGAPLTAAEEGIRLVPYYDSVGVKTWCRGETEVGYKEKFTHSECDLLFNIRYGYYSYRTTMLYNDNAQKLVTPPIHAAMVDMSYNVGLTAMQKSSMIRNLNEGKPQEACASILLYKYAKGNDCSKPGNKICPGVWARRQKMEQLCKSGIPRNT